MELLSIIPIVAAIVQIIILIVFFVMASNIAKIKNQMIMNTRQYIEAGDMEAYAGNKTKAKEFYLKAKYRIEVLKDFSNLTGDSQPLPGMSRSNLEDKISNMDK